MKLKFFINAFANLFNFAPRGTTPAALALDKLYSKYATSSVADGLRRDFQMVGKDIFKAIKAYPTNEQKTKK